MANLVVLYNLQTSTGAPSEPFLADDLDHVLVQASLAAGTATLIFEASLDGVQYDRVYGVELGNTTAVNSISLTAPDGAVVRLESAPYVRVSLSSVSGGAAVNVLALGVE
jgi:hypothetical protein